MADVTNAFGTPVEELDGLPLSTVVARGLPGARLVKGSNHLAATTLGAGPEREGGRRVMFLASDDEDAAAPVRALAEQLGFAPVWLGKLAKAARSFRCAGGPGHRDRKGTVSTASRVGTRPASRSGRRLTWAGRSCCNRVTPALPAA